MLRPTRTKQKPLLLERRLSFSPVQRKTVLGEKRSVKQPLLKVEKSKSKEMGFFKNLFKKKKGGTFVGNLIRGVASTATGGLLGNGAQLRQWEAEQEAKKDQTILSDLQTLKAQQRANAKNIGSDLLNLAIENKMTNGQTDPNAGEAVVITTLKKWWWAVALVFVSFGGVVYLIARKK